MIWLISQPHTPCLGRTFFLTEGTRQLSRASFSPFPFYQLLPCMQRIALNNHSSLPSFIYLQFLLSPFPSQPAVFCFCLYSLQTLCRKSPVVHLCAHNCSAHAIPRSCVSQQLFPSSRSSTTVSVLGWGWYRCYTLAEDQKVSYSHHFDQFWVSVLTVAGPLL